MIISLLSIIRSTYISLYQPELYDFFTFFFFLMRSGVINGLMLIAVVITRLAVRPTNIYSIDMTANDIG